MSESASPKLPSMDELMAMLIFDLREASSEWLHRAGRSWVKPGMGFAESILALGAAIAISVCWWGILSESPLAAAGLSIHWGFSAWCGLAAKGAPTENAASIPTGLATSAIWALHASAIAAIALGSVGEPPLTTLGALAASAALEAAAFGAAGRKAAKDARARSHAEAFKRCMAARLARASEEQAWENARQEAQELGAECGSVQRRGEPSQPRRL